MKADFLSEYKKNLDHFLSAVVDFAPVKAGDKKIFQIATVQTKWDLMVAIADENSLYFLEFLDPLRIEAKIRSFKQNTLSMLVPGSPFPIQSITQELQDYFSGTLKEFKTPLSYAGSPFQKNVWDALKKIPYGKTCSYANIAVAVNSPLAVRAVGNANAANKLAIVVPCHRVIAHNGGIGGYAGGIKRKEWLLAHERKMAN